ncbi:MAG: hypothetical protein QOC66_1632 [Pseudonocardiales bacterium]|jgi:hypothetical protein|nr:hypothetical protein [Pseudonocardiales bacterium]
MAWRIKAKYYESCNCAYGCPCNMNGFPTHGNCEGTVMFQVVEGERDGVDLTGTKVAAAAMWPGAIHEGNGKLAVFIDGTEEQGAAMVPILMAEDPGLPWEILAATMSEVHGPFFETIELDDNRMESHIKVGDKLDVKLETFKNPVNGEVHEPHMVLKDGFIFQDGLIGTSSANRVDADGVAFDHAGNNSYYAEVEWSSENRMAPAVPAS